MLGLHRMIMTLCTLSVEVCAYRSILSSYILDWYPIWQRLLKHVVSHVFILKLASLSCLLSGALNAKNGLHGFSPRSPLPLVVSTHLKLSFKRGELHF